GSRRRTRASSGGAASTTPGRRSKRRGGWRTTREPAIGGDRGRLHGLRVDKLPRLSPSRRLRDLCSMPNPPPGSWTLRCDGGARGNPGPGALAYVLTDPTGCEVEARGEMLGVVTNNVAEYRALIAGLAAAARHGAEPLTVCMDSELVVRQMTG